QYAHEKGLVHRDIKPGNLLVDQGGTVKILDMGLSRFDGDENSVLTKDVLGTLDYLAPEQARDSHRVDIRADIYSLGGTFYYLLTASPPFGKEQLDPLHIGQQTLSVPPVRKLRPDVPAPLADLVGRMLNPDPKRRPQVP